MSSSLLRNAAIYGLAEFTTRVIAFAAFPIYAYIFSVEEFGIFALVSAAVMLLALFANLGMSTAMQRFYLERNVTVSDRNHIVTNGLFVLIVWSGLVTLFALCVFVVFRHLIFERYAIEFGIATIAILTAAPGQVLQYVQDVLRVKFLPWHFASIAVLKSVAGIIVGIILVLQFKYRIDGLFLGQLIAATVAVPIALWLIRSDLVRGTNTRLRREMITYGYPFVFGGLAYWIIGSLDVWMLGTLSDSKEVGWYGIAARIAIIMTFINSAFGQAWAPFALKVYAENPDYTSVLSYSFGVWLFALCAVGSLLSLFAYEALWLLTPREYWPAAPTLSALVCGMVMLGTTQMSVLGLSLARQTQVIARCAWYAAALHFLMNVALIPTFGALGAGIASIVSYSLLSGLYMFYSLRAQHLRIDWRRYLPLLTVPFAATGIGIGAAQFEWSWSVAAAKMVFVLFILAYGWRSGLLRNENLRTAWASIRKRGTLSR